MATRNQTIMRLRDDLEQALVTIQLLEETLAANQRILASRILLHMEAGQASELNQV